MSEGGAMTFYAKFLKHEAEVDDIFQYVKEWRIVHKPTSNLYDYLGLTEEYYNIFIYSPRVAESLRERKVISSHDDFIKERDKIVKKYIEALTQLGKDLDAILHLKLKTIATSDTGINELERKILSAIHNYDMKELEFRQNLVALYKKKNKPHLLSLDDIITNKENEVKELIEEDLEKSIAIRDAMLEGTYKVRLAIQSDFFNWISSLNFEEIKQRYLDLATGKIEGEYTAKLIKALGYILNKK